MTAALSGHLARDGSAGAAAWWQDGRFETVALTATWGGLGSAASDGSIGGALSGHLAWDGSAVAAAGLHRR